MTSAVKAIIFMALAIMTVLVGAEAGAEEQDEPLPDTEQCADDEIDMGQYCMKMVPAEPEPPGAPKTTPFRKESMMPGVVRRPVGKEQKPKPAPGPVPKPAVVVTQTIPSPVIAQGGFGIQLGAWSRRESAAGVCTSVLPHVSGVFLSPIQRGETDIWACVAGPFANKEAASEDLAFLRADERFRQAFIKPLNGMRVEAVADEALATVPD